MKPFTLVLSGVLGVFLFFSHASMAQAATCTAIATGNWNTALTWVCDTGLVNHVPLSTDDVVVTSALATTITVDTAAVANTVTVTNTAVALTQNVVLAVGSNSLTVSSGGGISINGGGATGRNAQVTVSTGTLTIPGSITFNNVRARFISTGASTTTIGGNFGSGGTLTTSGTGTIDFNGGVAQTVGTYTTYNTVSINNTSGGVTLAGATTFGGALSINAGTLDTGSATFIANGPTTVNSTLLISNTTGAKTFNDLTIANGGVMSFTAAEAILMGNATGLGGNLTINGTGAITGTSGLWTFSKTGGGSITGTSTATQTIGAATFTTSYSNSLKITVTGTTTATGPTITNMGTYTASGALSGVGGTFLQGVGGILNIGLTSAITTLDASASPNEVHYTGAAAQVVHAGTYRNLFIEKPGAGAAGVGTTSGGSITVNGDLSVTTGALADGGNQITGNATGALSLATGTTLTLGAAAAATSFPTAFTAGHTTLNASSTVNYNATTAQTISDVPTYGNLTLTGAATKTAAGAITVAGKLTNTTATTGILADGGFTITVNGNTTMTGPHTGTGKILLTGGSVPHAVTGAGYHNLELDDANGVLLSGTTTIGGSLSITSGTWDTGAVTLIVTGATTVNGTLLISSVTGAKTFNDLTIANGGVMSFTAAEAILMGNATGLGGNLTINGTGAITGTSGLWTFQKVGGGIIGGTAPSITIPGAVTFTTAYTLPAAFTVNGTMTVGTGVNEINAAAVTINGTLAGAGTFTQGGGTTLAARSVTITVLDATAAGNNVVFSSGAGGAIKGTTYVNMVIDKTTLTATAAGTVDVLGNLTITSGVLSFAGSIFTVHGTTDIFGTLTDSSGGPLGGNNIFQGLVTVHTGAIWNAIIGEVCDFHFQNGLVMNGASFTSSTGTYYFEANNQSISGSSSFAIDNLAVDTIQLTNNSTGILTLKKTMSGAGEFIQGTNAVLNIEGTSTIATLTATASGNSVNYTGAAAQTVHAGTCQTLTVDGNTFGSVDITSDTTANTILTLGPTILSTGSSHMIMGPGATVSRTTGFINGYLQQNIPTGSPVLTFQIGSGTDYTPVDLNFNGVTVPGNLLVNTTTGDHLSIAISDMIASRSVNRFYTVSNSGVSFGTYGATFTFVSADIDSGATPADFILAKFDSGTWSRPTLGTVTATSVSTTGMTSFSDFQVGEPDIIPTPIDTNDDDDSSSANFPSDIFLQFRVVPLQPDAPLPLPEALPQSASPSGVPTASVPAGSDLLALSSEKAPLFDIIVEPIQSSPQNFIPFIVFSTLSEIILLLLGVFVVRRIRRYDHKDDELILY